MKKILSLLLIVQVVTGCVKVPTTRSLPAASSLPFPNYETLTGEDKARADTLLATALDHEALYSLMGDLKPVSSIGFALSYPLGKDSTQIIGQEHIVNTGADSIQTFLAELESWNRVLDALTFDRYRFLLVPFKKVWDGERDLQILVCRTDLVDSLLAARDSFFAQWGFVPGTDPAVLLTAIEFEEKSDRFRAYGYLFGYPQHAVDFFVAADLEKEKTGDFVKRSFFHIPVHAKTSGHFTYALPEGFQPLPRDSARYYRAKEILEGYRQVRPRFIDAAGNLKAVELYRDWWHKRAKHGPQKRNAN